MLRTREVRLGATMAGILLTAFGLLAALTVSQRSDLERRVVSSFSEGLRTHAALRGWETHCNKVETYHFACIARSGVRRISYDLTFLDSGCWRATMPRLKARGVPPSFPRRLRGCVGEADPGGTARLRTEEFPVEIVYVGHQALRRVASGDVVAAP